MIIYKRLEMIELEITGETVEVAKMFIIEIMMLKFLLFFIEMVMFIMMNETVGLIVE